MTRSGFVTWTGPLGAAFSHNFFIEQIREMYRQAVNRLLEEAAETEEFFRAGIVAIDITEADPFTSIMS